MDIYLLKKCLFYKLLYSMRTKIYQCKVIPQETVWRNFYAYNEKDLKKLSKAGNFKIVESYELKFPNRFDIDIDLIKWANDNHLFWVRLNENFEIRERWVPIAKYIYIYMLWAHKNTQKKTWYYILDWDIVSWISWRAIKHKKLLKSKKK